MKKYKYRPVLFFVLAYLFTWMFWIPAVFVPENIGIIFMLIGLIAPAVISTIFVLASDSEALKQDLKNKVFGFYKVKWQNVINLIRVWLDCFYAFPVTCKQLLYIIRKTSKLI